MGKSCSKLSTRVYELTKGNNGRSDVRQVNEILETCAVESGKAHRKVVRWALKALGDKTKKKLGPLAKHALTEFLCQRRELMTDKQRSKFVVRAYEKPPDLQFGLSKKRKKT